MQVAIVVLLVLIFLVLLSIAIRVASVQETVKKIDDWDATLK